MIKLITLLQEVLDTPKYKIYCDLDGVLIDFAKGYKDLTGKTPPPPESSQDLTQFWTPIDKAGVDFWAKLHWTQDGHQLWNYIKPYKPEILTAPSRHQSSREGKLIWVKRHTGNVPVNFKSAKLKSQLASPNSILIDDRGDTINRWNQAGGIGIHHTSTNSTIKQLKDLGYK